MKTSKIVIEPADFFDLDKQVKGLLFKTDKKKTNFFCNLQHGNALGRVPCVPVMHAPLGMCGKKDMGGRGLQVIQYKLNGGKSGSFMKVNLALKAHEQRDLRNLCKSIYTGWLNKHSPTTRSTEYQSMFPELTDGTKVHLATKALINTDLLATTDIPVDHYQSPCATYGSFLFDEDLDGSPWYNSIDVAEGFPEREDTASTDYRIMFFDDKGRQIGNKTEDDVEVYKKGGLPLMSTKAVSILTNSDFYKKGRWVCSTVVQVYAMNLKIGENMDGDKVIYPEFRMRTRGSLRMQQVAKVDDPNALTFDQRTSIMDSIIFAGVTAPSRKRKRSSPSVSASKPKVAKLKEKIPETGINTDGESGSDDDDVNESE
jgi:hypothetical protein